MIFDRRATFGFGAKIIAEEGVLGTWAERPWDNDGAADWYAELFETTGLRDRVMAALEGDVHPDDAQEARAAAHVVVQLGRVYVWPIKTLQADLRAAADTLTTIRDGLATRPNPYQAMIEDIDRDIAALRERIK